jgi:hypothetical protein
METEREKIAELRVREQVIRMHLNDYTNVAIADKLKVKYHAVEKMVNSFKEQCQSMAYFPEQVINLRKMEERLIELAVKGNGMDWKEQKEYDVLKSCYATADINNFSVLAL